jgi:WD40 repeat protein
VFSPDSERVAVTSFPATCWDGEGCEHAAIEVFDADDLRPLNVRYGGGLDQPSVDVVYSPSGDMIAGIEPVAFPQPGRIAIWDVDEPSAPIALLSFDTGAIRYASPDSGPPGWLAFAPDSSHLYAGGVGPTVVFDLDSRDPIQEFAGEGALALSRDGTSIAILNAPTRVGLLDTSDGQQRVELIGHDALVTGAAFSPDGGQIATVSNDESVMVWDSATGQRIHVLQGHAGTVLGVAFATDGTTLYTTAADGSMMIWDLEGAGGVARRVLEPAMATGSAAAIWISPTADSVVVPGSLTHRLVHLDAGDHIDWDAEDWAWGAYSPDGERFAVVNWSGRLSVRDTRDGALLASSAGRGVGNWGAVAFSADGATVVVADSDGTVTEYDSESLESTGRSVDLGVEPPGSIRATGNGVVAVTSIDVNLKEGTEVVFGSLDLGRVLNRVQVPFPFAKANFSQDGTTYAIGGFDGRLGLIDVATAEFIGPKDPLHTGPVAAVTFSPGDETLATLGFDGELTLVDPATGLERARAQPGPINVLASVEFQPDGDSVLIAYDDGSVIEFATDPAAWIDHACRIAGRNLTEAEWRDAFGDRPYRETCGDARRQVPTKSTRKRSFR